MSGSKKVLFLVPYPIQKAPSQRFRVENFLPFLTAESITYKIAPFMDIDTWSVLYSGGSTLKKVIGICKGYLKRIKNTLIDVRNYDYIFIHREATPIGPPLIEWFIAKVLKKKIIFDFDDAIWIAPSSQNKILTFLKFYSKTGKICKWSHQVVGGNTYLCNYAKRFNTNVIEIPTCVNTIDAHNRLKKQETEKVVIGWTGSHSTMIYLDFFIPVYRRLYKKFNIDFVIISNKAPEYNDPGIKFIKWQEATEVQDLMNINIGIMPLTNDAWSEGKCGFKLIQYLALGIPAVASPVGVNKIIIDEENGFLCTTEDEWFNALNTLLNDQNLRAQMGLNGRKKIQDQYCVYANKERFLQLFID